MSTVREKEAVLLYAILKGYKFIVGKIIENSILSYYRGGYKGLVPHSVLITRLCILGGVEAEIEREERDNIEIEQIQFDSATHKNP